MKHIEYGLIIDALNLRVRAKLTTSPEDLDVIIGSANIQKLAILRDVMGESIGYVAWGSINKYSVFNLINNRRLPRYFYEFSEGNICLLRSVFFLTGRSNEAILGLKKFLKTKRALTYIKDGRGVCLIRKKNMFFKEIDKQFLIAASSKQKATT